jgi:hypothetical protein
MVQLVPAEEETFEMERQEEMINSRQPLGHAVVISVFCFERELVETPRSRRGEAPGTPPRNHDPSNQSEGGVAVAN